MISTGVSLVVATRNRPEQFLRLVESLALQTVKDATVIVVDQSDAAIATRNAGALQLLDGVMPTICLRSEPRGLSAARNLALPLVDREFVAFPDDDCWYHPRCIETVLRHFVSNGPVDLITGRYGDEPCVPSTEAAVAPLTAWNCIRRINSVSIFVRTAVLQRSSAVFDRRLGAGSEMPAGEELDFVLTLLEGGASATYLPELVVGHPAPGRQPASAVRGLSLASSYVIARHALGASPILLPLIAFGILKGLFRSLARPAWRPADLGRLRGYSIALRERCFGHS